MVMAENALVTGEVSVGQLRQDEIPRGVAGIIAADLGKERAQGRGQSDQRVVLLLGEVELAQLLALDDTDDGLAREPGRSGAARSRDSTRSRADRGSRF